MNNMCSTHGADEKSTRNFIRRSQENGNFGVKEIILLKCILNKAGCEVVNWI